WSEPVEITRAVKKAGWTWYATGPGVGIQLKSGRLLVPCDHVVAGTREKRSHVIYSDDRGRTWKLGGSVGPDCNEAQAVELADGRVLLNTRSYGGTGEAGPALRRPRPGPRSLAAATSSPSRPRPCAASGSKMPAASRASGQVVRDARDGLRRQRSPQHRAE